MELHTLRGRLTAGLLNKAQRGELALRLPVGLLRDDQGQVSKDPNREVQARLELIFNTFLRLRSACKVLRFLNEEHLLIPRRDSFGDLVWQKPTTAAILAVLKNPAYAGAFVDGRSSTTRNPIGRATTRRLPQDQWRICVQDKYPAYISWETFTQIQTMLADNYAEYDRNQTRGVPRPGAALLHGLVYCGACGHKMVVQYKGATRYLCNYLRTCPRFRNVRPADRRTAPLRQMCQGLRQAEALGWGEVLHAIHARRAFAPIVLAHLAHG